MDLYYGNRYVLLFFIYGLAFFTMGISALQQTSGQSSNFPLLKANKYLGYFGLIHGITEWILMVIIGRFMEEAIPNLILIAALFNTISFTFILNFGIQLTEYQGKHEKLIKRIPWIIFSLWVLLYLSTYFYFGFASPRWIITYDVLARYFIGLPGCLITSVTLYKNAKIMCNFKNIKNIAFKLKIMAVTFAIYGILAGLVVSYRDFFPANYINRNLFYNLTGVPVEFMRTIAAIVITIMFISIIDIFKWETNLKISKLSDQNSISLERRKLARELHDVIIQNLFATGLQVENLIEGDNDIDDSQLHEIKSNLNTTIAEIREFMKKLSPKSMDIEQLRVKVNDLISNYRGVNSLRINFNYQIPDITLGSISSEQINQVYYIIQEGVTNAVKHSKANEINLTIGSTLKYIVVLVEDNGVGFNIKDADKLDSYGLLLMKERAAVAKGALSIKSSEEGTTVILTIPWEG